MSKFLESRKSLADVQNGNVWCIFGGGGVGKTTLAGTFPGIKVVFNIGENGASVLNDQTGLSFDIFDFPTINDALLSGELEGVIGQVKAKAAGAQFTVVLDGFGSLYTMGAYHDAKNNKDYKHEIGHPPQQQNWGRGTAIVIDILQRMIALSVKHNFILAILGHELEEDKNDKKSGKTFYRGTVMGPNYKLGKQIGTIVDHVLYMQKSTEVEYVDGKPVVHKWRRAYYDKGEDFDLKLRTKEWLPVDDPGYIENPTYEKLMKKINGK